MLTDSGGAVPMPAAAAAAVELSIERIREIGATTMAQLESATSEGTTTFKNIEPTAAHFSSVPLAQEFHAQQQAAKEAFVATIEGILSDLRSFGTNLVASAEAHEQTDAEVQAALASFGEHYVDRELATNVSFDEYRGDVALNSTGAQQAEQAPGQQDSGAESSAEQAAESAEDNAGPTATGFGED